MTPSLVIKLPLPRSLQHEPSGLPPCRKVEAPHINPKKRGFGVAIDSEEGSEKSISLLTAEPMIKRQRLALKKTAQSTQVDNGLPEPRGQPEVWAEVIHI